jgi:aminopeptidase N
MDQFTRVRWCFLSLVLFCLPVMAANPVHHVINVTLDPESGQLEAEDVITLPEAATRVTFDLHAGLKLELVTPGAKIIRRTNKRSSVPIKRYKIKLPEKQNRLEVKYSGEIRHKLKDNSRERSGGRTTTPGVISPQGVFLSTSSYWFPVFKDGMVSFSLQATLPEGWYSISQGSSDRDNSWSESAPQDDIYLIAGKYHRYNYATNGTEAQVWLREHDPDLAERYLKATESYLQLYSRLLGPYPYSKFSLVENFWESGYGMPSFTLLGPRVIRFPFILHSSYPHEILHNWWGNGVFVDFSKGNWSEGLTTYLADHLIREQQGQGSAYRRDTLQNYVDYVSRKRDFPLKKFRGHHGQSSQAVGYGKTMMFFHMLRMELGDETFLQGIRLFFKDNLHRTAAFADLQKALETASGKELKTQFKQWTGRTGAPALEVSEYDVEKVDDGYKFSFTIRQSQRGAAYRLQVPVHVQTEDPAETIHQVVSMTKREARVTLELQNRPASIIVDPLFDLFRRLDPTETPSSVGQLLGAKRSLVVLPSEAEPEMREAYKELADSWRNRSRRIRVVWDTTIKDIPSSGMVWIMGKENLLADEFIQTTAGLPLSGDGDEVQIGGQGFPLDRHSIVLTGRRPNTIGWLHGSSLAAIAGLARKVPHYGKYSFLAFSGDNPDNVLKGQWPVVNSALYHRLQAGVPQLQFSEHPPLSDQIGQEGPGQQTVSESD